MEEALKMGALAFFGEKYGEQVRVIRFGESIELCGGTHVVSTAQIGLFKIISEGAIAAGIRRIEAISGDHAIQFMNEQAAIVKDIKHLLKNTQDVVKGVQQLMDQSNELQKKIDELQKVKILHLETSLLAQAEKVNDILFIGATVDLDTEGMRDLAFRIRSKVTDLFLILGAVIGDKAHLALMISDNLVNTRGFHAGNLIHDLAKEIAGGGGGQPHYATAGGKDVSGLNMAITKARLLIS